MDNIFNNIAAIMLAFMVGLFTYVLTKHCRYDKKDKPECKCSK